MSQYGTMTGAYFVSRGEIIKWINDLLGLGYSKVEQCCNGAAYCQILDAVFPGDVPLKKVNFDAKLEHDMIKNYKVLQTVFDKKGISKAIEVNKLVKGKAMDNLEFLQWFKQFYDTQAPSGDYNAAERRGGQVIINKENDKQPTGPAKRRAAAPSSEADTGSQAPRTARGSARNSSTASGSKRPLEEARAGNVKSSSGPAKASTQGAKDAKVRELTEEVTSLQLTVHELEKERDFYFAKLRQVEIRCQTTDAGANFKSFADELLEILYSTDDSVPEEDESSPEAAPEQQEAESVAQAPEIEAQ